MTAPRPRSRDFGAALAGLVLGGSTLFLLVLMIVWLTNAKYSKEKAEHAAPAASVTTAPPAAH